MNDSDEALKQRMLYLIEVEHLSRRQMACRLRMGFRRIKRILDGIPAGKSGPKSDKSAASIEPFRSLIDRWYLEYPRLMAVKVYERLKEHGYEGSLTAVERLTRPHRNPKPQSFRELVLLPAEEAQVDWLVASLQNVGQVFCFLYLMAYSRFAFAKFYPRSSFEFFLAGHLEAFRRINGIVRSHRYDNLKSVVLKRGKERIDYNPQFLDFARHFGFKIRVCNVARANEKGRVERLGLDVRGFLYGKTFKHFSDLNGQFRDWLAQRNNRLHRITGKAPSELLKDEKLMPLPSVWYQPCRIVPVVVSKTAMVDFESNRYSVPSYHATKKGTLLAYPERIEVRINDSAAAVHKRSFERLKIIQNPLHEECLLNRSPRFKMQRIHRLIVGMEPLFAEFVGGQSDEPSIHSAAYMIFKLLKTHGRQMILSAIRELLAVGCLKPPALQNLLNPSGGKSEIPPVNPSDASLLDIRYQERNLSDYDPT
jgi:transposase